MVISYDIFVVKVRTVIRFTLSHKFPTTWRYFELKKVFKQNQAKQNAHKKVQHRKRRLKLPKVMNQAEKLIQKKIKRDGQMFRQWRMQIIALSCPVNPAVCNRFGAQLIVRRQLARKVFLRIQHFTNLQVSSGRKWWWQKELTGRTFGAGVQDYRHGCGFRRVEVCVPGKKGSRQPHWQHRPRNSPELLGLLFCHTQERRPEICTSFWHISVWLQINIIA